jgi:hypothetical protein
MAPELSDRADPVEVREPQDVKEIRANRRRESPEGVGVGPSSLVLDCQQLPLIGYTL